MSTLPIFDPLPVPPVEPSERAQELVRDREAAALQQADGQPSPDKTPDQLPSRTPTAVAAPVQVAVPARVWTTTPPMEPEREPAPVKDPGQVQIQPV